MLSCPDWPPLWNNDNELAIYVAKGRLAHGACKLAHAKMLELYLKEFE